MKADEMVDAALAGFDQGEFVTIPSLPDTADWEAYEASRDKLNRTCPAVLRRSATASARKRQLEQG
jgi:hypothetical protein